MHIHKVLRYIIPWSLRRAHKRRQWARIRQYYAGLSVSETFDRIYRTKAWGWIDDEVFFSGLGSTPEFAIPYVEWLKRFIAEHKVSSIVDLGCGDFRVGRLLCEATGVQYTGIDVVQDLISFNQKTFGRGGVSFECRNIIEDDLPDGDLCLIRQVLQHLSNREILQVLAKCNKYRHVLITEDVYVGRDRRPNYDKPHAPDNRLYDRSGVYLELPPYSLNHSVVLELEISLESVPPGSVMRTSLVEGKAMSVCGLKGEAVDQSASIRGTDVDGKRSARRR